jgi:hypothetical protein
MRLFLALGLTLIVGLGAAFRPSDNLPGREASVADSAQIVGGACPGCYMRTCGGGTCPASNGACLAGGGNMTATTDFCGGNCSIYMSCVVCDGG